SAGGGGAPHSFKESGRGSLQQMTKGRRKPWRLRLPTGTGPSTSRSYVLDQDADKHPSCQCWPEPSKTLPVEHSSSSEPACVAEGSSALRRPARRSLANRVPRRRQAAPECGV